ncbi:universal stress protein [Chitinophagaceae bacterium LWZ2-11]
METILLPTDFSSTAANAGLYAIEFAKQVGASKIVLYHAYQAPVNIGTDAIMPVNLLDIDTLKEAAEIGAKGFKERLEPHASGIKLETMTEFNLLVSGIDEVCETVKADIIIMGITGGGAIEEKFIGSNAISIAKHTSVPVIVVPPESTFSSIREILLVSDYKEVEKTTPIDQIKKILISTKAKLFVLHVTNSNESNTAAPEGSVLHSLLKEFNPQFKFIDSPNFTETINDYATEIKADLIITIPKKHGLFDAIFKRSHTKMLAFHSHVPLMVVHT